MARTHLSRTPIQVQLNAVRRAASSASLACTSDGGKLRSYRSKAQEHRDNLTAAAITLSAVRDSREALDFMPDVQRDQLAIRLAALGYRAVRIDGAVEAPEVIRG